MPLTNTLEVVIVTVFLTIDIIKSLDLIIPMLSASQSSTYNRMEASRTIDGNMDSVSHTYSGRDTTAWLRIQLPRNFSVFKVTIYNAGPYTRSENIFGDIYKTC